MYRLPRGQNLVAAQNVSKKSTWKDSSGKSCADEKVMQLNCLLPLLVKVFLLLQRLQLFLLMPMYDGIPLILKKVKKHIGIGCLSNTIRLETICLGKSLGLTNFN